MGHPRLCDQKLEVGEVSEVSRLMKHDEASKAKHDASSNFAHSGLWLAAKGLVPRCSGYERDFDFATCRNHRLRGQSV